MAKDDKQNGPTLKVIAGWSVGVAVIFLTSVGVLYWKGEAELVNRLTLGGGTFLTGIFGAGALLFATMIGLSGYEQLSERLFTRRNSILFILFGGGVAVLFWVQTPTVYTPLYSAGIGAAWPAVLQGLMASSKAKAIADDEANAQQARLARIDGGR